MPIRKAHLERLKKEGYNLREIRAIESGTSQNAVAQVKKFREALQKDPELRKKFRNKLDKYRASEEKRWTKIRTYSDYAALFSDILGSSLLRFLEAQAKGKKELSILDDGAGKGYFLKEVKEMLATRKIKCNTTAVVLTKDPDFARGIDHVYVGPSELFLSNKKYDVIFSYYGSIHYADRTNIKNLLLKYANLLNRGGVALIGADLIGIRTPLYDQMRIAFKKQGFELTHKPRYVAGEPSDVIMIRRL